MHNCDASGCTVRRACIFERPPLRAAWRDPLATSSLQQGGAFFLQSSNRLVSQLLPSLCKSPLLRTFLHKP